MSTKKPVQPPKPKRAKASVLKGVQLGPSTPPPGALLKGYGAKVFAGK